MLTPRQAAIAATAGPDNWGALISADHARVAPETALPLINTALRQQCNTVEGAFTALAGLAGAALVLSYSIADTSRHHALEVFRECRNTANNLECAGTPVDYKSAISAVNKILYSRDTLASAMLLVDIIRIANHITES